MRFAYQQSNGIAAILIATPKAQVESDLGLTPRPLPDGTISLGLSDADYLALVMSGIPMNATLVHELVEPWVAPAQNRTIRNAWVTDGTTVTVDLSKAKALAVVKVQALGHPNLVPQINSSTTIAQLLAILITAGDTN